MKPLKEGSSKFNDGPPFELVRKFIFLLYVYIFVIRPTIAQY
jgi:hypothetical protein